MGNRNQAQNVNDNNKALLHLNDDNDQNLIPGEEQNKIIQGRSIKNFIIRQRCHIT